MILTNWLNGHQHNDKVTVLYQVWQSPVLLNSQVLLSFICAGIKQSFQPQVCKPPSAQILAPIWPLQDFYNTNYSRLIFKISPRCVKYLSAPGWVRGPCTLAIFNVKSQIKKQSFSQVLFKLEKVKKRKNLPLVIGHWWHPALMKSLETKGTFMEVTENEPGDVWRILVSWKRLLWERLDLVRLATNMWEETVQCVDNLVAQWVWEMVSRVKRCVIAAAARVRSMVRITMSIKRGGQKVCDVFGPKDFHLQRFLTADFFSSQFKLT